MKLIIDNTNSPKGATLEGVVPTADLRRRLVAPRRSTKAEVRSLDAMVDLVWIRLRRAGAVLCFGGNFRAYDIVRYRRFDYVRKNIQALHVDISPNTNIQHPSSTLSASASQGYSAVPRTPLSHSQPTNSAWYLLACLRPWCLS